MEVAGKKLKSERSYSLCEPCKVENVKTTATGACLECKEYMCTTCFRHHLKGKLCRNHMLLTLEEMSTMSLDKSTEDVEICRKHDNELMKFYCRKHDIVGCGECIVLGHTTCKPEYIKDIAKTFQNEDFKKLVKKLEMLESNKTKHLETIQKNKDEVGSMEEKALEEIRQFRSDINTYLDKAETDILPEVKELVSENNENQKKLEQDVKSIVAEIEEVKLKLNADIHGGNAFFINAVHCKSKLNDIEKMDKKIKQDSILKRFEFVRGERLSRILQDAHQFGQLNYPWRDAGTSVVAERERRRGPRWLNRNHDKKQMPPEPLFVDDDEEDDDLFSNFSTKDMKPKPPSNLFGDDDDDDDDDLNWLNLPEPFKIG